MFLRNEALLEISVVSGLAYTLIFLALKLFVSPGGNLHLFMYSSQKTVH